MITENDWQKKYREALKSYKEVSSFFELKETISLKYDVLIPLDFAKKVKAHGPSSPLWNQFIPKKIENELRGSLDPIGDKKKSQGSGIIKRYKNRILFTPTSNCPVICRYCFRKNELSDNDKIFKTDLKNLKKFLDSDTAIDEVILTGGDPLILSDSKIEEIATVISTTNVKYLRFHTRTPIILPTRITKNFISLLQKLTELFERVIFVLHTNHADELDSEVLTHVKELASIPRLDLRTQSVLLKDVNNTKKDLVELFKLVVEAGFTPYYLHHPDQARGAVHYWLPLEQGRRLYNQLRNELPGWSIPHYIIDHQSGHGKQLAFNPESFKFSGKLLNIHDNYSFYDCP